MCFVCLCLLERVESSLGYKLSDCRSCICIPAVSPVPRSILTSYVSVFKFIGPGFVSEIPHATRKKKKKNKDYEST